MISQSDLDTFELEIKRENIGYTHTELADDLLNSESELADGLLDSESGLADDLLDPTEEVVGTYPELTIGSFENAISVLKQTLLNPDYLNGSEYSLSMQRFVTAETNNVKRIFENDKTSVSADIRAEIRAELAAQMSEDIREEVIAQIRQEDNKALVDKLREEITIKMRKGLINRLNEIKKSEAPDKYQTAATRKEAKEQLEKVAEQLLEDENIEIERMYSSLAENLSSRTPEYRDNFGVLVRLEKIIRSVERISQRGATDASKLNATAKLMDYQEKQLGVLERLMNVQKSGQIEKITRKFFMELRKHPDLKVVAERYLALLNNID